MKFLGFMWNPLSWVMEAAAIMAIALANGGVNARLHGLLFMFLSSISSLLFIVLSTIYLLAGKAPGLARFCWYHHPAYH